MAVIVKAALLPQLQLPAVTANQLQLPAPLGKQPVAPGPQDFFLPTTSSSSSFGSSGHGSSSSRAALSRHRSADPNSRHGVRTAEYRPTVSQNTDNSHRPSVPKRSTALLSPFTEKWSKQREWGGDQNRPTKDASRPLPTLEADPQRPEEVAVLRQVAPQQEPSPSAPPEAEGGAAGGREEQDDIAARLPELREVLAMLRERKLREGGPDSSMGAGPPGDVYLVGTGPGDPELLTVKALRLLQRADLILYDRLVSTDILDMTHPAARLLYVGKTAGYHSRTQEEIHELLLNFAEAGATVVRLKGGDPLVFGRGGEEMDFLQEQGVHVRIVPGITAASGISAELGIPLTHRGLASSVRFLTGHSRKGGEDPLCAARPAAADPDSTLVIYMGLATLPGVAAKLLAGGLPASTPAVAVERGTTPDQRTVFATLADLPDRVAAARLVSPTLIVVGRVVALSHLWPGARLARAAAAPTPDAAAAAAADVRREARDRRLRGPDPLLPSQL